MRRSTRSCLTIVGLLLGACGGTPSAVVSPDLELGPSRDGLSRLDGAVGDGKRSDLSRPPDIRPPDRSKGEWRCAAGCNEMCQLAMGCWLYQGAADACSSECASWAAPLKSCLQDLICTGNAACAGAQACIVEPPKPDLTITGLTATVKGNVVTYTFKACNQGKGASDPFAVDLYYQSTAAPAAKATGDQSQYHAALASGACAGFMLQRNNAPPGTYSSWVRADAAEKVAESDETNNTAGPVSATVAAPPQPDLIVKQLEGKVTGQTIDYTMEICNVGQAGSFVFRADIYFNRLTAPGTWQVGDENALFLGLAAGACQTVTKSYQNAQVGIYASWAQVDTLGTVQESDENNNVSGPKVIAISSSAECAGLCTFATGCGVFGALEFQTCLTWCNELNAATKQCALDAGKKLDCSALKACNLPPAPPAPPPPWACLRVCNQLIDPCKLLPQDQLLSCTAACVGLPTTKLQCAVDAVGKKQCFEVFLCIF